MVLCPYWRRTEHGTVRCEYLGQEFLDEYDPDAREKSIRHFAALSIEPCLAHSWLYDEWKICGVREDSMDDTDDESGVGDERV